MELEDSDLHECIDDIIAILEDEKELKARPKAKEAVCQLQKLKDKEFLITTHDEKAACRSAMEAIANESVKLKLTIDQAMNDIKKKEEEALQIIDDKSKKMVDDALDTLEARNECQIESMKRSIETLTEKVTRIETENSVMYKHLIEIDTDLNTLKEARDKNTEKLNCIKQMQKLQRELVVRYERFYTKTSESPLRSNDDDIGIAAVYIEPLMIEEKKGKALNDKDKERNADTTILYSREGQSSKEKVEGQKSKPKTIKGYHGIFHSEDSRRRRIYIIGNVGSGKTSFSKMMLHNWCRAHYNQSEEKESGQDSDGNTTGLSCGNYNIEEMKYFNFLFYIPLLRLSGFSSDLFEIIKEVYKDILSADLIKALFENESQKCCILVDGLDEWTPSENKHIPQHVSYGIPSGHRLRNASIVTLSRPSAKGILNLKSSEFDVRIKLLGVDADEVKELAKRYMEIQNKNDLSVNEFMDEAVANFKHLEKTPLLVKQLVWMLNQGIEIEDSVAGVYCNIINIMLGWCENKDDSKADEEPIKFENYEVMQLPTKLSIFPRCRKNRSLILVLGKLAFDALLGNSPIFGRSILTESGLSKLDISELTKTGILEEEVNIDPTLEQTSFTFTHMSYLEFFGAVYISINNSNTRDPTTSKRRKCDISTPLQELFKKVKSAADILQLSNVVEMICDLSPDLFGEVAGHVYDIVETDDSLASYRTTLLENDMDEPEMIQTLLEDCYFKCYPDGTSVTTISLSDIIIYEGTRWSFLGRLNTQKVLSVCVCNLFNGPENIYEWIPRLSKLQILCIFTEDIRCEDFDKLLHSVQKVVSLRMLIMYDRRYDNPLQRPLLCENVYDCPTHFINLTDHENLVEIHFQNVSCFEFGIKDPYQLETLCLIDSFGHNVNYDGIVAFVQRAKNLKELTLVLTYGESDELYSVDLSQHFKLEHVDLTHFIPSFGSIENVTNLSSFSFSISEYSHRLTAKVCDQLASVLSNAVSLKSLSIKDVRCSHMCPNHVIDLSRHDKLHSAEIIDSCFVDVNSRITITTEYSCSLPDLFHNFDNIACSI